MPSNFGDGNITEMNETISGDDEQKIENLKTLAREGKTGMAYIEIDRVAKMYDWIDTEMCFKEYKTEEKLQELYGLFAQEFELESETSQHRITKDLFYHFFDNVDKILLSSLSPKHKMYFSTLFCNDSICPIKVKKL